MMKNRLGGKGYEGWVVGEFGSGDQSLHRPYVRQHSECCLAERTKRRQPKSAEGKVCPETQRLARRVVESYSVMGRMVAGRRLMANRICLAGDDRFGSYESDKPLIK